MRTYLITGGAGFIGVNTAAKPIQEGNEVVILDNLSRKGTRSNLKWLKAQGDLEFLESDIRDFEAVQTTFQRFRIDVVIHLEAQVAVTTSVLDPREDFMVNALGTLNILEGARLSGQDPIVLHSSTNKVYGGMEDSRGL